MRFRNFCSVLVAAAFVVPAAVADHGHMPQVGRMHKKLHKFAGKWTSTTVYFPSKMMPKGGTGTGFAKTVVILDGFCVRTSVVAQMGKMGTYKGEGFETWNPHKKLYHMVWADNHGGISTWWGTRKGNRLVYESTQTWGGRKIQMRIVNVVVDDHTYTMAYQMMAPADQPKKAEHPEHPKRSEHPEHPKKSEHPKQAMAPGMWHTHFKSTYKRVVVEHPKRSEHPEHPKKSDHPKKAEHPH